MTETKNQNHQETSSIEWRTSSSLVPYEQAIQEMEKRVEAILNGNAPELVWLLEHPPLYTLGTGTKDGDILNIGNIPAIQTGRGGRTTYHGPGQRVVYLMLDLRKRLTTNGKPDLRAYVSALENWIIDSLHSFNIDGQVDPENVGVWVNGPHKTQDKIAAIGIRVRKWVTYHGIAINVHPNLSHYKGIVPCGLHQRGVTSFEKLGVNISISKVDQLLKNRFSTYFG